jgi:hypothetical protein
MTKTDKQLTAEQEAIRNAQNDARSLLPADTQERIALIFNFSLKKEAEKKAVAEAKEEAGAAAALDHLVKKRGLEKDAIGFIDKLSKKEAPIRARILAQVFGYADDFGWFLRDLFDAAAVGVGTADDAGEGAVFDSTSEGGRRGGTKAQPRTVEEMAATHTPEATPGLPLEEALRKLEEYRAANPPKAGRKPKALTDLEKAVEAARAAHNDAEAGPAELPEAQPGEITGALREGNAESEAHIREASTGPSAPPAEEPAVEATTEKPKRGRKKAEPAAPPPPPAEDEYDDTIPVGPPVHRPDALGAEPSSYRVG